jgi:hypothetical protein
MIHVCSGDMGHQAWCRAGLPGTARIWRDSPAVGPWSPDPVRRAELRGRFWGMEDAALAAREEAETLRLLAQDGQGVLWFSQEPWDQMAMLWVVASLARVGPGLVLQRAPLREGGDGVPPAILEAAFQGRLPIPPAEREAAARLWERFEAGDWTELRTWAGSGPILGALPDLRPALARVLEDRPPHRPGRSERQVQELMAAGTRELGPLMAALAALEMPYGIAWYGDLYVRKLMDGFPDLAKRTSAL